MHSKRTAKDVASGDDHATFGTFNPVPPTSPAQDPWPVDVTGHDAPPCGCAPPPAKVPKPPCTRSVPKDKTCCEPTRRAPIDPADAYRKPHKPKVKPKVKLANWCCDWPVKDAVAPVMVLMFERALKGLAPKNEFEKSIYGFVRSLDHKHRDAFAVGAKAYREIPDARRCGFETRFDDWPDDRPVDGGFVAKVVAKELVSLGRYAVFAKQDGQASVGDTRLWEQTVALHPDDKSTPVPLVGPWPWICAVNPGADDIQWFRNRDVVVPDHSDIAKVDFKGHEFALTCTATTDPKNPKSISIDCVDDVTILMGGVAPSCTGGVNYNYTNPATKAPRCLAIPKCVAGQGVALRGFNFLSLATTAVVRKIGGGFPDMTLACEIMGDDNPPTANASCAIRDHALFTLPRSVRDGLNDRDVPTGRYTVELHVPNESHYAPAPGPAPTEFVSNTAIIEIIPPLDIDYQVWIERGDCYEETAGPGDDEPWFRSYTAAYRAVGKQSIDITSHDVFNQEDIESGDWIGFPPVTPFDGRLERDGCVAIAIVGLEVDSKDAARDQITGFGESYTLYFKQLFTGLAGGADSIIAAPGVATFFKTGAITASLIAGGIGALAILVGGLFFASWAPADPIGYDLLVFDMVTLYNLSTPPGATRIQDAGNIGGITWSSYPKGFTITAADIAQYREERQYWSDDEESKYALDFMVTRLP